MLARLTMKNTDSLIGAVADELAREGITLVDSTTFLEDSLAQTGVMTRRKPSKDEQADLEYGRSIANALAQWDIGQSVAVSSRACVAVEAMEGTDAMLRRAASLVNGKPLVLVKVATRRQHFLFDVPVVGVETIAVTQKLPGLANSRDVFILRLRRRAACTPQWLLLLISIPRQEQSSTG